VAFRRGPRADEPAPGAHPAEKMINS
jgi:hypothetical protein